MQTDVKRKLGPPYLDTLDFETQTVTRDKEEHYILIKGTIQQEDIIIINMLIFKKKLKMNKYLCSQYGSTQIHKIIKSKHKGTN